MRKIKSFTVLELIIVLVLTGTVIAIAYSGASLFFKEFMIFQHRSDNAAGISLLNRLFIKDFDRSDFIYKDNQQLKCVNRDKSIYYGFNSEYIIRRDSLIVDTFKVEISGVQSRFEGNEVMDGVIDNLAFSIFHNDDSIKFQYNKKYNAESFINYLNLKSK